jgi:hypothetical protein
MFDLPRVQADLFEAAFRAQGGVSTRAERGQLETKVAAERPDAVIVPLENAHLSDEGRRFLEERSRVPLLGIGVRDNRAVLYELRPNRSELGEFAPEELPDIVRRVVVQEVEA